MSYLVLATFDIKDGNSEDYRKAYECLDRLGLSARLTSDSGNDVLLPTTTTGGIFTGTSAVDIRDDVHTLAYRELSNLGIKGELFVSVGEHWAWKRTES